MTPAIAHAPEVETEATASGRLVDACRQATHVSHEARRLKSLAADAIDDGVHAAKRAIKSVKRGVEELEDLRDEAVHRVKREPIKAVGITLGVGLVLGAAIGWAASRLGRGE